MWARAHTLKPFIFQKQIMRKRRRTTTTHGVHDNNATNNTRWQHQRARSPSTQSKVRMRWTQPATRERCEYGRLWAESARVCVRVFCCVFFIWRKRERIVNINWKPRDTEDRQYTMWTEYFVLVVAAAHYSLRPRFVSVCIERNLHKILPCSVPSSGTAHGTHRSKWIFNSEICLLIVNFDSVQKRNNKTKTSFFFYPFQFPALIVVAHMSCQRMKGTSNFITNTCLSKNEFQFTVAYGFAIIIRRDTKFPIENDF